MWTTHGYWHGAGEPDPETQPPLRTKCGGPALCALCAREAAEAAPDSPAQPVDAPKPTVCRMVHYVSYGTPGGEYHSRCRAAIITEVGQWVTVRQVSEIADLTKEPQTRTVIQQWKPDACALAVINPTGVFFNGAAAVACEHSEDEHRGGTWHWPERA